VYVCVHVRMCVRARVCVEVCGMCARVCVLMCVVCVCVCVCWTDTHTHRACVCVCVRECVRVCVMRVYIHPTSPKSLPRPPHTQTYSDYVAHAQTSGAKYGYVCVCGVRGRDFGDVGCIYTRITQTRAHSRTHTQTPLELNLYR